MANPTWLSDDVIRAVEAIGEALVAGSATYSPDPVTLSIAGKTITLTPSVAVSVK